MLGVFLEVVSLATPCNSLHIDVDGLMKALIDYITSAMTGLEDKMIREMQHDVDAGGNNFPKNWKAMVKENIKMIERTVARNYVRSLVGLQGSDEAIRKGVIIQTGGGGRIAGPLGRTVWDNDYHAQHPSNVLYAHRLPASWVRPGNDWFDVAIANMQAHLKSDLDAIAASCPIRFSDFVIVS